MRTRPPTSSAEPSRIASTLSSRAISGRAFCAPLYFIAEVREMTRSALMRARSEMSASVMPSAKYSCAGSFDTLLSGRTASDRMVSGATSAGRPTAAGSPIRRSASLTLPADAGRSAASLLMHEAIRRSSSGGSSGRTLRIGAGALFRISNMSASARSFTNGRRPVVIS